MGDFERLLDRAGAGWEHKYQDHRLMFILMNILPMVLLVGFFWFFFLSQNSYLSDAPRLLSLPWSLSAFIPLLSPSVL